MSKSKFLQTVAERLEPFCQDDERLGSLLGFSVGRLMVRSLGRSGNLDEFEDNAIAHVVDWLRAAIAHNAAWLDNVDSLGRPKKLLKFGSLKNLLTEVDRSMLIEAQKLGNISLIEGDEILYATLEDGMTLVRLLTPAALDRETAEMQHCIGSGGYDDLLGHENYLLLSLRDRFGKAHVSIEISGGVVQQIQGKQNRVPAQKYVEALVPFFKQERFQIGKRPKRQGFITDRQGNIYLANDLQPGIIFDGDLSLADFPVSSLPENLTIRGDLSLCFSDLKSLPNFLTVEGALDLRKSLITALPEDLKVGRLLISGIPLTSLPERLFVGADLNLFNSSITSLPIGLEVGGSLSICRTAISVLPIGLKVGGSLYLEGTLVETLPEGLWVGKNLSLAGSLVKSLPNKLHVGECLNIAGTGIEDLPDTIADTTLIVRNCGSIEASNFKRHSSHMLRSSALLRAAP